ncbi:cilia- and flagella-associated protein 65 [Lasioglossum baleicum]|uniref:cilia- and flagella-associated protein 65 n=1 Tax=Lasioglossum baleicum TaxID=434251 RepID=UPI003FCC8BC0
MNGNIGKTIRLNFDDVEVGKTAVKTIELWNESCNYELTYQVQRDPITNPLDHVFHLRSYTWVLAPKEKYVCEIRYKPYIPFSVNVDYFIITDSFGNSSKVITRGSCIGPNVTCSTSRIVLISTDKNPVPKWRIKLINNSRASALFMFAIDDNYQPFKSDKKHGSIHPLGCKYATITFTPSEDGIYSYRLFILILHQKPIVIDLYGYRSAFYNREDPSYFNFPPKEKNGFVGYVNDSIDATVDLPAVSLSKNYFDFGRTEFEIEDGSQRITQAICLTNHSPCELLIVWEKDRDNVFNVTPNELLVKGQQSVLFDLSFHPNANNNLFGREIVASVFRTHWEDIVFPFVMAIRVIGHSFPVSSNGWIPQYEIPQTVIMPPCVPPFPVYTTFLVRRFGHLPLMFQFVPPPNSRFTVKPMLGLIHENFQIIMVKMTPKNENLQIYLERWTIYFNGNTKNASYIDFKGYGEYANILFLNGGVLDFAPVLPRCQQFKEFGFRNTTRHKIKYTFYQIPTELTMQTSSGELEPNETLIQEYSFQPNEPYDYDFEMQCVLIVIKNDSIIGLKSCVILRVRGRCKEGTLVATPEELNFQEIEYNSTKTLNFNLYNHSQVNIHYKLICAHRNWPLGDLGQDIQIRPAIGTIFTTYPKKISISITPHTPGYYEFVVQYLVRINSRIDTVVSNQIPIRVCIAYCMCVLPTLQVHNICAYGIKQTSPMNVSKPFLWKALEIDKLNRIFKEIVPGEREKWNVTFFPVIANQGTVFIKLTLKNCSRFSVPWSFKMHPCGCKPVLKKIGYSFQKKELDCFHQKICFLQPLSGKVEGYTEAVLTIEVHHIVLGKSELTWDLDIGHNRHITLNMLLDCISESEQEYNFLYGTSVKFGHIYFGNRDAVYKVHWICNITNTNLAYCVNIDDISKINERYHCEVFSCLTMAGIVEARSAMPLLLRFQPRMFGLFKVVVPITLGHHTMELRLEGESSGDFRSTIVGKSIPIYCTCKTLEFPVYFNIDCIDMWSLPMHNTIIKMIIIQNNLDQDALGFEWKYEHASEILGVEVFPRKGIISPNTVKCFQLKLFTRGYSGRCDLDIFCEFMNASDERKYRRSILKYNLLSKELEGQFVITEKGTTVPKPWLKVLDKPEAFHKTLSFRCTIYPIEDECLRVSLKEELEAAPSHAIFLDDRANYNITGSEKELNIATFILEGLLWDIVNGRRFLKTMKESLIPKTKLYYSQFAMSLAERKRLIKRSFISPPFTFINSILEEILFLILHEEFSLDMAHLIPKEDVRHANYIKTILKHHIPLEEEDIPLPDAQTRERHSKGAFRVSFSA